VTETLEVTVRWLRVPQPTFETIRISRRNYKFWRLNLWWKRL